MSALCALRLRTNQEVVEETDGAGTETATQRGSSIKTMETVVSRSVGPRTFYNVVVPAFVVIAVVLAPQVLGVARDDLI